MGPEGRRAQEERENVNRKLSRLMEPNIRPVVVCLILFVALAIPFSPTLALVEADYKEPGAPLLVDIRGRKVEAELVKTPFYKRG